MSASGAERATPRYAWSGEWLDPADSTLVMTHTALVVTRDGQILTGAAGEPTLVARDRAGITLRRTPVDVALDLHDLTLVEEGGQELLWVADTATRLYGGEPSLKIDKIASRGAVHQIDLEGRLLRTLDPPPLAVYESVDFRPTAVAVDERRFGGSGDIWVADGYGASLVHRFDESGRHLASSSGEEGAGRFNEPHDVLIDRRRATPELYVTDRVNQRIQVFDLDGGYRRTVGEGEIPGPTQMAISDDDLVVTDLLSGRVSVFDGDDRLRGHLFAHPSPPRAWDQTPDGWPNARSGDGLIAAVALVPGSFHTPHGIAVDDDGLIYVSEFAIGGRIAVLTPASD